MEITSQQPLSGGQPPSQTSFSSQRASILLRLINRAYLVDGRDVPALKKENGEPNKAGQDWWKEVLEAWADALADIPEDHLIGAFSRAARTQRDGYLLKPAAVLRAYGDMVDERLSLAQVEYADTSLGMEQPSGSEDFNLWPLCKLLCEIEDRLDGNRGKVGGMRMFGMIKTALQAHRWYGVGMSELLNFVRALGGEKHGDYADFLDALLPVEAWEA
jgi:hypothetical protein